MSVFSRVLTLAAVVLSVAGAAPNASETDPFLWLENVHGERALAWVKNENAKTLAILQHDPHFARFYAAALAVGASKDRIPFPTVMNGRIYNFWQDPEHVRGVWRTTTIAEYGDPNPAWTTVLDVDALAKAENKNWNFEGADCSSPSGLRCLISLSDGGEDATTVREFDLSNSTFVAGGFVLPRGKQNAGWSDEDTLLVSRAWQPGEVTASGYPYIVKTVRRGAPLSAAVELTRGTPADVTVGPGILNDEQGNRLIYVVRGVSFFETKRQIVTPDGLRPLAVPRKSRFRALVAGRLVISLAESWNTAGGTFPSGSLVAVDLAAVMADPQHLKPALVYAPGPREALDGAYGANGRLIVTTYDNVRGRAAIYTPAAGDAWTKRPVALPDNATIVPIVSPDPRSDVVYLAVTRLLTPTALYQLDTAGAQIVAVRSLPPQFDASHDVVEQHEAISRDGTKVPYLIVRPQNLRFDGTNPTLLYAYGGFAASQTPFYSGTFGRLWYAHGGVFVLANIRGGGEFGPAWHEAGLKTHRQRVYDDFAAVARDLIARKITSARRLGIMGGSNGGLLMGVEFTQHPELYAAVDIQVPLLDMLRYEKIQAGASWAGEYGSVANPAERKFLAAISPYNNLHPGTRYPVPLIWTTTKDDRVGPQHARKFAAKLGAMHIPYLFYEVTEGGHGSGANIKERAFTSALEFTYLTRRLMNAGR